MFLPLPTSAPDLLPTSCPVCRGRFVFAGGIAGRALPQLEALSDDAGGGWRVSCYGCHTVTAGFAATPREALALWALGQVRPYA
jgi:hypothetical protein